MKRVAKLLPFALAVAIVAFGVWWFSGLHITNTAQDPRGDDSPGALNGECP
jgi:hypothetical protein